jgi:hypothetical protein
MFIDKNKYFLTASHDGLINSDAIFEIKCPYSVIRYLVITLFISLYLLFISLYNSQIFFVN